MAYDKDRPATSEPIKTGWPVLLTNQAAIEAALDQDHDFATGGTQTGKHNKVSLVEAADLGAGAEGLPILGAQTAGGKAELVFTDEDDNDVQITENGKTKSSSSDMKDEDNMSSNSATHTATQQSIKAYSDSAAQTLSNKTLTSPVVNTAISGSAVLDEDDMSSNSATKIATQQSIKAYVDANATKVVQSVYTKTGALIDCPTALPVDTTTPQSNEGTQVMTLAITPTSASNKLRITVVVHGASDTGLIWCAALFQDAAASAIAATTGQSTGLGIISSATVIFEMTAGTTALTTFKVRLGTASGDGQFNSDLYGNLVFSSITIEEIKP